MKKIKAKKKNKNHKNKRVDIPKTKYPLLTSRVKRWIISIVLFVSALVVSFSFFEKAGKGGQFLFFTFNFLIGKTIFSLPLFLVLGGVLFLKPQKKRVFAPVAAAIFLLILGTCGFFESLDSSENLGGALGYFLSWPLLRFFGTLVTEIIFAALILISFLILWEFVPKKPKFQSSARQPLFGEAIGEREGRERDELLKKKSDKSLPIKIPEFAIKKIKEENKEDLLKPSKGLRPEKEDFPLALKGEYKAPTIELLSNSGQKPLAGDIEYSSLVIKKTLADFGISVEMDEVNVGPAVTQYTLKPAEGVKLSRIVALSNDLSLTLASHPIRIEAPIPGRSLVGIEVPNKGRASVSLKELVSSPQFQGASSPLVFPLGKDVAGTKVFSELAKMPHLLVAGSTGSGKTIFLQSLIVSLLFRNSPRILRLILIDPKRVEFPIYTLLPHLLTPVVFEAAKAANLLNWLIGEMERRFEVLREVRVRDIQSFNQIVSKSPKMQDEYGIMPYIVLIIDELADLMAAKGREIEAGVVRLSQLARAVGIHLVVATQRPSVDIITGLIKANFTSRVAFQVASQVDSRTILDAAGAEKLLGSGDMLFLSSEFGKPKRIQGCFITQQEVKKVVAFIQRENEPGEERQIEKSLSQELEKSSEVSPGGVDFEDPLYEEARKVIGEYRRASASLLQRRLKIGYARAARLLDILEEKGVVGPADGAKPRELYLKDTREQNQNSDWQKL